MKVRHITNAIRDLTHRSLDDELDFDDLKKCRDYFGNMVKERERVHDANKMLTIDIGDIVIYSHGRGKNKTRVRAVVVEKLVRKLRIRFPDPGGMKAYTIPVSLVEAIYNHRGEAK